MTKLVLLSLLTLLAASRPAFAATDASCNGTYSSSLGGVEYTVNLFKYEDTTLSTKTLLQGSLAAPNLNVALVGYVGINNTCFLSAWINNSVSYSSMVLVGKLTETSINGVPAGIFSFDGGQSTYGLVGPIVLPLTKKSDSASFAPFSAPVATVSYAGVHTMTYGGSPAVLTLAQGNSTATTDTLMHGTKLFGKLDVLNGTSLYVRGFVDANNEAFLTTWFSSGILVGKLNFESGSTTRTALHFSKGYIGLNLVSDIDFRNVELANGTTATGPADFSGTYSGFYTGSNGSITLVQSGSTLTGSGSHLTLDSNATFTDTITGTVSGNIATVTWNTNDACIVTSGTLTLSGKSLILNTQKTGTLSPCALPGRPGGSLEGIIGIISR